MIRFAQQYARVAQRTNPADAHAQAISGGASQEERRTCAEVARSIRAAGAPTNDASHAEAQRKRSTSCPAERQPADAIRRGVPSALIIATLLAFASSTPALAQEPLGLLGTTAFGQLALASQSLPLGNAASINEPVAADLLADQVPALQKRADGGCRDAEAFGNLGGSDAVHACSYRLAASTNEKRESILNLPTGTPNLVSLLQRQRRPAGVGEVGFTQTPAPSWCGREVALLDSQLGFVSRLALHLIDFPWPVKLSYHNHGLPLENVADDLLNGGEAVSRPLAVFLADKSARGLNGLPGDFADTLVVVGAEVLILGERLDFAASVKVLLGVSDFSDLGVFVGSGSVARQFGFCVLQPAFANQLDGGHCQSLSLSRVYPCIIPTYSPHAIGYRQDSQNNPAIPKNPQKTAQDFFCQAQEPLGGPLIDRIEVSNKLGSCGLLSFKAAPRGILIRVAIMAQVTYAAFLSWLISFGQHLPVILGKLNDAITTLTELATIVRGTLPEAVYSPSEDETALEGEVAQLVAGPNAAFDGSRLRAIFKFANDSGLLPILISLLTKSV